MTDQLATEAANVIDELRADKARLTQRLDEMTEFSDRVNSVILCHQCQPKLERALNGKGEGE